MESKNSCGGEKRGLCTKNKVCECKTGWVGPHCLSAEGYNDFEWDPPDHLTDVGFSPPEFAFNGLIVGLSIVIFVLLVATKWRRQLLEGWTPIPEAEPKHLAAKYNRWSMWCISNFSCFQILKYLSVFDRALALLKQRMILLENTELGSMRGFCKIQSAVWRAILHWFGCLLWLLRLFEIATAWLRSIF